jgi:hypothetical protein
MSATDGRKQDEATRAGRPPEGSRVGIATAAGLGELPGATSRPVVDRIEAVFRLFRHFSD